MPPANHQINLKGPWFLYVRNERGDDVWTSKLKIRTNDDWKQWNNAINETSLLTAMDGDLSAKRLDVIFERPFNWPNPVSDNEKVVVAVQGVLPDSVWLNDLHVIEIDRQIGFEKTHRFLPNFELKSSGNRLRIQFESSANDVAEANLSQMFLIESVSLQVEPKSGEPGKA